MALNVIPVSVHDYHGLLSKFDAKFHAKLGLYTAEELFYVYKLATYKGKPIPEKDKAGKPVLNKQGKQVISYSTSDLFYLTLKAKLMNWLNGRCCSNPACYKHGINPMAWAKLGSRFKNEFYGYVVECVIAHDEFQTRTG